MLLFEAGSPSIALVSVELTPVSVFSVLGLKSYTALDQSFLTLTIDKVGNCCYSEETHVSNNKGFLIFDLLKNYKSHLNICHSFRFCVFIEFLCVQTCVSVLLCVYCGFPLTFSLLFILSYSTIFFFRCLFYEWEKKSLDLNERKWEVGRISAELVGRTYKNILYKNLFSIKENRGKL